MAEENRAEHIANQLRRDILMGVFAPGAPIKERDNAIEMGVSRTPMREAIRILAKEGLVVLRPSRSPIVAQPTLKEVSNAIEVLSALEMLSVQLACEHATQEDLTRIRAIEQNMAKNYDKLDDVERFEVDMSFHIAIAKASHNEMLAETHSSYLARLWRARFLSATQKRSRERVLRQHGAIVAGLEARDVAMAQKDTNAHLEHLLINVQEYFQFESGADGAADDPTGSGS
ncbi:GntR family transcriptional regulator [Phaeobacter sp. J2-8]|uniref:GntR family transcriptional regulator n=1 Tax=Phaeobacter sp. J2-8 TaxID=2931394 RepID=UPI001FD1FA20|nr:GntR family transcriptional regulator [Phaeobacter sp. J2-8]MCJ7871440.1 GntR family transcriptional regulator [Phaeobacter sp. J2-8]